MPPSEPGVVKVKFYGDRGSVPASGRGTLYPAEMARKTGAKRQALFHHDPSHNDGFLKAQEIRLCADFPDISEIVMAYEGLTITL